MIQAALLTLVFIAIWGFFDLETPGYTTTQAAPEAQTVLNTPAEQGVQHLMNEGVQLLNDPASASLALQRFDRVLAINPGHYGARYQRARALDLALDLEVARQAWSAVLPEAERTRDIEAAQWAAARISDLDVRIASLSSVMNEGVDLLHNQQVPDRAVPLFQEVLTGWPSHYGASYQLAVALERSGQRQAARNAWSRVLENAQAIGEQADGQAAREALARLDGE